MIIPIPTNNEPEEIHVPAHADENKAAWISWYMNCPNWICILCGATMFGRCKYCVSCKLTRKKDVPRPTSYVENVFPTQLHQEVGLDQ